MLGLPRNDDTILLSLWPCVRTPPFVQAVLPGLCEEGGERGLQMNANIILLSVCACLCACLTACAGCTSWAMRKRRTSQRTQQRGCVWICSGWGLAPSKLRIGSGANAAEQQKHDAVVRCALHLALLKRWTRMPHYPMQYRCIVLCSLLHAVRSSLCAARTTCRASPPARRAGCSAGLQCWSLLTTGARRATTLSQVGPVPCMPRHNHPIFRPHALCSSCCKLYHLRCCQDPHVTTLCHSCCACQCRCPGARYHTASGQPACALLSLPSLWLSGFSARSKALFCCCCAAVVQATIAAIVTQGALGTSGWRCLTCMQHASASRCECRQLDKIGLQQQPRACRLDMRSTCWCCIAALMRRWQQLKQQPSVEIHVQCIPRRQHGCTRRGV